MSNIQGRITVNEIEVLEVDGDPSTGLGTVAAVGSLALVDTGGVWQKTGAADTDWERLSPRRKAGRVPAVSFTGSPKKFTVVFAVPFPDSNYEVTLSTQTDARVLLYESKLNTGFVINTNAATAMTGEVSWSAFYEDAT